jgi:hypothetical protein
VAILAGLVLFGDFKISCVMGARDQESKWGVKLIIVQSILSNDQKKQNKKTLNKKRKKKEHSGLEGPTVWPSLTWLKVAIIACPK